MPTKTLARGGFDHLVVPSGTSHYQLFDDRDYPMRSIRNSIWLPLTRVPNSWLVYTPGERPKVVFHQPFDYWHVVPDAPSGWWVEHFDIHLIRKPDEALALLPKAGRPLRDPGRTRRARWGTTCRTIHEPVVNYLEYHRSYKTPYEIALMRERNGLACADIAPRKPRSAMATASSPSTWPIAARWARTWASCPITISWP